MVASRHPCPNLRMACEWLIVAHSQRESPLQRCDESVASGRLITNVDCVSISAATHHQSVLSGCGFVREACIGCATVRPLGSSWHSWVHARTCSPYLSNRGLLGAPVLVERNHLRQDRFHMAGAVKTFP